MNENMQPNNNPMENMPPVNNSGMNNFQNENKASIGSIIGTIIIIAVIILGGLYFWGKRIDEARLIQQEQVLDNSGTNEDAEIENIRNVNESDDINSIEADLRATDLDGLGSELEVQLQ